MLDIEKIGTEIKTLEETPCTTYGVCEKLAMLYIIRDHYGGNGPRPEERTTEVISPSKAL